MKDFEFLTLFENKTHSDSRGYFRETFRASLFEELSGLKCKFVQDNEAFSKEAFVLRGLHFQKPPKAQAKLIRVINGSIYDVVVDLRQESPTFGQWKSFELSAKKSNSLFVPEGFAHAYLTLEENTLVTYKVSNYYAPETEGGIIWNDPQLNIKWHLSDNTPIISEKDLLLPNFSELGKIF